MDAPSPELSGGAGRLARASGLWVGLAALGLGGLMVGQAWGTPFFVPGRGSGAMAFPLVVGWGLVATGALLLARTLAGRDGREAMAWPAAGGRVRVIGLTVLGVGYVVLLDQVGFSAANLVVGLGCLRLLGGYGWAWSGALAVVLAVGLALVFEYLLGVSLPRGLLGM